VLEGKDNSSNDIEIDTNKVDCWDSFTVILVRILILVRIFANSIRIPVEISDFSNI
jgi:hypothetical protein